MMIALGASRLTRMAAGVASLQPLGCTFKRARFVPSVNCSRSNLGAQSITQATQVLRKYRACLHAGFRPVCGMSTSVLDAPRKRVRRRLGPHTREHQLLAGLDWRTREGKLLAAARAELIAQVGGHPNNVQKALIERAARLTLYIELMDRDAVEAGTMSERNSRQYLAWVSHHDQSQDRWYLSPARRQAALCRLV